VRRRWDRELDAAIDAAWVAGRLTLRWFQADPVVDLKADRSPVTAADREAEHAIRALLGSRFPEDGFIGEEHGEEAGRSGRRWIVDPIDGTRSFVHGVPLYGVMVALEADGQPVLGVLHFPALNETVAAALGAGCRWNGRPCRVSDRDRLDRALVVTSGDTRATGPGEAEPREGGPAHPPDLAARLAGLRRVADRAATYRTWGDCYGYALVATGRAEAMLDPVLNVWDAAAVRPVVEESGGVFSDWAGSPSHEAGHAVGTNARLADAIRQELARGAGGGR
jgi:histidinol-phosphatase